MKKEGTHLVICEQAQVPGNLHPAGVGCYAQCYPNPHGVGQSCGDSSVNYHLTQATAGSLQGCRGLSLQCSGTGFSFWGL